MIRITTVRKTKSEWRNPFFARYTSLFFDAVRIGPIIFYKMFGPEFKL
jgi:hypothetical protein